MSTPCPCGSGLSLDSCCGPFLSGPTAPPTAEALMRSRYSAFVRQDWGYLERTQANRDDEPPADDIEWLGLDVLATHGGAEQDTEGTVEFVARYRHQGRPAALHEISRFRKQDGKWLYLDGEFPLQRPLPNPLPAPARSVTAESGSKAARSGETGEGTNVISRREMAVKIGRNDPCPCGSGKKYKKCCAHD